MARILIIDDDVTLRQALTKHLEHAGHEVRQAADRDAGRRARGRAACCAATKLAIWCNVRKSSISSSSNDTWMEKCSSRDASSFTNVRESTMPAVNKSTSAAGTSICRRSANSCAMRASSSRASRIRQLPVLAGEEVVQQPVVGPAVDPVAASLPPDVAEAEPLQPPTGGHVDLDGPSTDGLEAHRPGA